MYGFSNVSGKNITSIFKLLITTVELCKNKKPSQGKLPMSELKSYLFLMFNYGLRIPFSNYLFNVLHQTLLLKKNNKAGSFH